MADKKKAKNQDAVRLGAKGGAKGGPARAAALTATERERIARQGGEAKAKKK